MLGVGQGAVIPIVVLAAVDRGASVAMAGAIVALRGVGTMAFDVPAGMLVARIGERRAMVLATAALVASLVGSAASPSPLPFACSTLLMGCSWSVWLLARQSYVTEVMPAGLRGRALSTVGGINRIGTFIGPVVAAAAISVGGLDAAFVVHIVTGVIGCAVLAAVPDRFSHGAGDEGRRLGVLGLVRANRHTFVTVGTATLAIGILRASRQVVLPLWADHIGLGPESIGIVFAVSAAMDMVLFYPAGYVSDRWGRRPVAIPCLALLAAGHMLVPLAGGFATLCVVGIVIGFGNGLGSGIVMTLGADFSPASNRASFLGAFRLIGDAGTAVGPVAVAAATAVASIAFASIAVGSVGLVAAALVAARMPESRVSSTVTEERTLH